MTLEKKKNCVVKFKGIIPTLKKLAKTHPISNNYDYTVWNEIVALLKPIK